MMWIPLQVSRDEICNQIKLKSEQTREKEIGKKRLQDVGWLGEELDMYDPNIVDDVPDTDVFNQDGIIFNKKNGVT